MGAIIALFAGFTLVSSTLWVRAEKQKQVIIDERKETKSAQRSFRKATLNVVGAVLADAQQDIYKLRYEEALQKYREAYKLGRSHMKVARGFMELAFYYAENNPQLALGLADSAAKLVIISPQALELLEEAKKQDETYLMKLDSALYWMHAPWYDTLVNKYLPQMVSVAGMTVYRIAGKVPRNLGNFAIASTETTIWQYHYFCHSTQKDSVERIQDQIPWGLNGDNPMVSVNFYQAEAYANWLSSRRKHISPGRTYKIPTEAEWEYAAAGGASGYTSNGTSRYTYPGTSSKTQASGMIWHKDNSGSRTQAVATKATNTLGLYDMNGNVWEWTQNRLMVRGGSWNSELRDCRIVDRLMRGRNTQSNEIGFRVVLVPIDEESS